MDICFQALQGETTRRMVAAATQPATRTSDSLRRVTGLASTLGDFCWPGAWVVMPASRAALPLQQVLDDAA